MDKEELMNMLDKAGAVQYGHFLLSSGMHSDTYVQCALLLRDPEYAERVGKALYLLFSNIVFDLVVSPALGGIIIGYEVARSAHKPFIFTERNEKGKMMLRRGFTIESGMKALIIEDVITTGRSTREVKRVVEDHRGIVVGYGSIIDRSGNTWSNITPEKKESDTMSSIELRSLLRMDLNLYVPSECPLCAKSIPLKKPGSRKITKHN